MDIFKSNLLNQKGQALLIVVLVMVVALTVTLSLVSRSVVDLKTSTDQADSQRALAAAEAGAEQVIQSGNPTGFGRTLDTTNYSANITQVLGSTPFLVNGGNLINKNEGAYIWLSTPTYNAANAFSDSWSGKLTIYWGDKTGDANNAALEINLLYLTNPADLGSVKITKFAFDPSSSRTGKPSCPSGTNCFDNASIVKNASGDSSVPGRTFVYKVTIPVSNGLLVNVNPIYYSAYIGADGSVALPSQGSIITSSGTSGGSSSVSRKITVFQGYPQLPVELFPYSILSP